MAELERIAALERFIRELHGCAATHAQTTHVVEEFRGCVAWEGDVETFDLQGHAEARRCHAWIAVDGSGTPQPRAVLEIPPVIGPNSAVSSSF